MTNIPLDHGTGDELRESLEAVHYLLCAAVDELWEGDSPAKDTVAAAEVAMAAMVRTPSRVMALQQMDRS